MPGLSSAEWVDFTSTLGSFFGASSHLWGYHPELQPDLSAANKGLRREGINAVNLVKQLGAQSERVGGLAERREVRGSGLTQSGIPDLGNARLVLEICSRGSAKSVSNRQGRAAFLRKAALSRTLAATQDWIEHWPLPDGSPGMTELELLLAENGDSRAFASELRYRSLPGYGQPPTILMQPQHGAVKHSAWKGQKAGAVEILAPANQSRSV